MTERQELTRIDQLSSEWFTARCGRVTASNVSNALSRLTRKSGIKVPGDPTATCDTYRIQVIAETLTGIPVDHYVSPAMDNGRELEPVAVAEYEFQTGQDTEKTGLWLHPVIERFAASPDRLVGSEGVLEIKCPLPTTHIEYMLDGRMPEEYADQVQSELACTERKWADFVSFCPLMPADLKMFRVRVERDEARIKAIEAGVLTFLEEVRDALKGLKSHATKFERQVRESVEGYITDDDIRAVDKNYVSS